MKKILLFFGGFCMFYCVVGQDLNSAITNEIFINAPTINNVANTGADFVIENQSFLKVMVYDGDSARIYWDADINSTQNQGRDKFTLDGVFDPDVVLTTDLQYALVVFESHGDIYISLWEYNGSGYSEIIGALGNYIFPYYLDEGSSPNIDMDHNNYIAVTWKNHNGEIKAIVGEYSAGPSFYFSNPVTIDYDSRDPDVSIYTDPVTSVEYVTFTYIRDINQGPDHEWVVLQETYTNIDNNNIISSATSLYNPGNPPYTIYGRPRIAAPFYHDLLFNGDEFFVVVDFITVDGATTTWEIPGYTYYNSNYYYLNYNPDHPYVPNNKPVVTYTGDLSVVAWQIYCYDDPLNPTTQSRNIIAWYTLFSTGGITSQDAAMVNLNTPIAQVFVSVAGRRANNDDVLYFWLDSDRGDMAYRTSPVGTIQMRKIREEDPEEISSDKLFAFEQYGKQLFIKSEFDHFGLLLSDISGRIILKSNDLSETSQSIDLSGLSKGVYIVKCYSGKHQETIKIVVSH